MSGSDFDLVLGYLSDLEEEKPRKKPVYPETLAFFGEIDADEYIELTVGPAPKEPK